MRFFEIASPPIEGPENSLIAILGHLKAKGVMEAPLSNIIELMQNAGHPINDSELTDLAKSNTAVQNLIKGISNDTVIIKSDDDTAMDTDNFMPGDEQDVAMMAKRAATRRE